jgi:PAS domain-containing protein
MFGYTEEEALGHHISLIIPQDQQEESSRMRNRVKNGETIHNQKIHMIRKDGKVIDAAVTLSPLFNEDGIQTGQSIIARDISHNYPERQPKVNRENDKIKHEKEVLGGYPDNQEAGAGIHALQAAGIVHQFPLSNALKMARDYIAILDRTGKCLWANDAFVGAVNASGCPDLEGKSIALYIAPEFRKIALDSLMEIKKSGNKTVQLMMLSSSGRVPVEANFSAINNEGGDLFGYMAIARNIERSKIEKLKR